MTFSSRALHILVATTLVFVNLVCPCASAMDSAAAMGSALAIDSAAAVSIDSNQHHDGVSASKCHDRPNDSEHPEESTLLDEHQDCLDCASALVLGCEQPELVVPAPQLAPTLLADAATDTDSDYPAVALSVTVGPPLALTPASVVQIFPANRQMSPADSPIRRHDRILV